MLFSVVKLLKFEAFEQKYKSKKIPEFPKSFRSLMTPMPRTRLSHRTVFCEQALASPLALASRQSASYFKLKAK